MLFVENYSDYFSVLLKRLFLMHMLKQTNLLSLTAFARLSDIFEKEIRTMGCGNTLFLHWFCLC